MSTKHKNLSSRSSTAHLSTDFSLAIARLLDYSNTRDQIIIRLLHETGITPRELVSLKKTDLQEKTNTIILREETTKHNVSRHVQLSSSLFKKILAYTYAQEQAKSGYLFSTRQSPQLTTRRIEQIFKDASKEIGLKEAITPRDCRNNYLSLATKQAKNEEELKTLTGLKSIQKRRSLTTKEQERLERTLKKAPRRTQDIVNHFLKTGIKLGEYIILQSSSKTHKVSQLSPRRIEQIISQIGIDSKIDKLTPNVLRATAIERGDAS